MIALALIALVAVAVLLTTTGARGTHAYAVVSILPLVVTVLVPQLLSDRQLILELTRMGIVLSFLLLAAGAVLMFRAVRSGDRIATIWLGAETVVAALPAIIVTAYYVAFCLL